MLHERRPLAVLQWRRARCAAHPGAHTVAIGGDPDSVCVVAATMSVMTTNEPAAHGRRLGDGVQRYGLLCSRSRRISTPPQIASPVTVSGGVPSAGGIVGGPDRSANPPITPVP